MTSTPTPSRRTLLASLIGAPLAASALSACAPVAGADPDAPVIPPADGPVKLQYWAWLKDLQKVCDIWNAKNPNIQVEAVWIPGGGSGGYQKIFSAIAAGGGPDIAQAELRMVPSYLLQGALTNLAPYGFEKSKNLYDPFQWSQVSFNGGIWAVPQDSGPAVFFYQPEILDPYGGPPKTWDDWYELATAIHTDDKSNYLEVFAVSDSSHLIAYAVQAGAQWFRLEDDQWVVSMSDEPTLNTARFFDRAITDGIVDTSTGSFTPGWYAGAVSGKYAAVSTGSWGDALVESVSGGAGKWRVAPLPVWGPDTYGSTVIGGSTAMITSTSQHPQEAVDFATWMTTTQEGIDAMIKYCGIGWSPSAEIVGTPRQSPSEFFSGQNYNRDVVAPAAKEQNSDWIWPPVLLESMGYLTNNFRKKVTEGLSLVDGITDAEQKTIAAMKAKGLAVREA